MRKAGGVGAGGGMAGSLHLRLNDGRWSGSFQVTKRWRACDGRVTVRCGQEPV